MNQPVSPRSAGEDDVLAQFAKLQTATITDAFLRLGLSGWMNGVLPLAAGMRIVGRARTIAYGPIRGTGKPELSMYALIGRLTAGEVLVIASGATDDNLLGDNMGTFAKRTGISGIVTDSKTRDRVGLAELGLPLFSRGASARPPVHVEVEAYDIPIWCGGAQVRPGDIIVGDDDGVLVVPENRAADVLFQTDDLLAAEKDIRAAILDGASLVEIERAVARKKVVRQREPGKQP